MNAKEEFVSHVEDIKSRVKAAIVQHDWSYDDNEDAPSFKLPVGYTEDDLKAFLDSLNFQYDAGYGGQELFGIIWYEDNTWSARGEYDGSEWWEHHQVPEIPEVLK